MQLARMLLILLATVLMPGCTDRAEVPAANSDGQGDHAAKPEAVRTLRTDLKHMPPELGAWFCKDEFPLHPDALNTGIFSPSNYVNRVYRDLNGRQASVSVMELSDPATGAGQDPIKIYRAAGYELLEKTTETVSLPDGTSFAATVSTWTYAKKTRVAVMSWFQIGNQVVPDAADVQRILRWHRASKQVGPLIRVQIQSSTDCLTGPELIVSDIAAQMGEWFVTPVP